MNNATVEVPEETRLESNGEEEKVVAERVLEKLGQPSNLYRVTAKAVGRHQYRVNIFCVAGTERSLPQIQMTDSFFVTFTDEGLQSQPSIVHKYN